MRNRYITFSIVGVAVGLLALVNASLCPTQFVGNISGASQWLIPYWDSQLSTPVSVRNLEHQAVLLRLAKLVLEDGFWFLILPPIVACGLLQLSEKGKRSASFRCIARGLWLLLWIGLAGYLLAFVSSCFDYRADIWADPESVFVKASATGWSIGTRGALIVGTYVVFSATFASFLVSIVTRKALYMTVTAKLLCLSFMCGLASSQFLDTDGFTNQYVARE